MKQFYRMLVVSAMLTVFVSISPGFAADKKQYPTAPPEKIVKKWRIGYYEGGAYRNYPITLNAIVNSLAGLGWIEPLTVPQYDEKDMNRIWEWLTANVKSKYLEFAADAYYSGNWKKELREQNKQVIIKRFNEKKDIDLMIAMGTWAGQDLANNEHHVPVIVGSVSDAVASKIVKSIDDSGYDHVNALVDPGRYPKQIYAFHDVIGFKKLGIALPDTVDGRSYAAIEHAQKIAKERNFEIVECHTLTGPVSPEINAKTVECALALAPKIDAFYLTIQSSVNKETLPRILSVMNEHKVPVFSQFGSDEVKQGALLSIATSTNLNSYGKFIAEAIAKIINGAKPRELDQVCEPPVKIAFNAATAMAIGLKPEIYNMLVRTAEEVYKEIEAGK